MKKKTLFEEEYYFPYRAICETNSCTEDWNGETDRRIVERADYYNGGDQHSHLVRDVTENNHLPVLNGVFNKLDIDCRKR